MPVFHSASPPVNNVPKEEKTLAPGLWGKGFFGFHTDDETTTHSGGVFLIKFKMLIRLTQQCGKLLFGGQKLVKKQWTVVVSPLGMKGKECAQMHENKFFLSNCPEGTPELSTVNCQLSTVNCPQKSPFFGKLRKRGDLLTFFLLQ